MNNSTSSMLKDQSSPRKALDWWLGELSAIKRPRREKDASWRLMILMTPKGLTLYKNRSGNPEKLAALQEPADAIALEAIRVKLRKLKTNPATTVLRLPRAKVISHTLSLPNNAIDVVEAILQNQIEQLAPWPASKAVWDHTLGAPSKSGTHRDVHLSITGKDVIESALKQVADLGLEPAIIDMGERPEDPQLFNLQPNHPKMDPGPTRRIGYLLASLLGLTLLTSGIGAVGLFDRYNQLSSIRTMNQRLISQTTALQQQTRQHLALQKQKKLLLDAKTQKPTSSVIIEALSQILPDDAWLSSLEARSNAVMIKGQAANASNLIELLERSPHFTNVRFSASTTHSLTRKLDSFSIRLEPASLIKLDQLNPGKTATKRGR